MEVSSLLATITRKPIFHGTAPNQEWFHALSASGALPDTDVLGKRDPYLGLELNELRFNLNTKHALHMEFSKNVATVL